MSKHNLHIILDAARATEPNLIKARELNPAGISLYRGMLEEKIETLGPFVFPFVHPTPFSDFYLNDGWGFSWGIFAVSDLPSEQIFHHFRQFIRIKKADSSEEFYFRFYDPRVLRTFLPTCDAHQLRSFFGNLNYLVAEDEDPSFCLKYSVQNQELKTERLSAKEWFDQINTGKTEDSVKPTSSSSSANDTSNTNTTNPNRNEPPTIHSPWID